MKSPQELLYDKYPDKEGDKEVGIYIDTQSVGKERHVYIAWVNGEGKRGTIYQELHLTGGPGNYSFIKHGCYDLTSTSVGHKNKYIFGTYDHARRNEWVQIASEVKFDKKSTTKNCQDWMRDFLDALVHKGQITEKQKEAAIAATIDKH